MSRQNRGKINQAAGWAPPANGETDDFDLTRDEHPALKEKRVHLEQAGVGRIIGQSSHKRSLSQHAPMSNGGGQSRRGLASYRPQSNSSGNKRSYFDRMAPVKQDQTVHYGQTGAHLPPHSNRERFSQNSNNVVSQPSRGISVARSQGLFDNLPIPRSADRRDPRHDHNYRDNGLGFGKQFEEMRRANEKPLTSEEQTLFDRKENYVTVGKQEPSLSDDEIVELPTRYNRTFDPSSIWGPPLSVKPVESAAILKSSQASLMSTDNQQSGPLKKRVALTKNGISTDAPRIDDVVMEEPTVADGGDWTAALLRMTDPERQRGQLLCDISVLIDLPDQQLPMPMAIHADDNIDVLARCFRIAFNQNAEWEQSLAMYVVSTRDRQIAANARLQGNASQPD